MKGKNEVGTLCGTVRLKSPHLYEAVIGIVFFGLYFLSAIYAASIFLYHESNAWVSIICAVAYLGIWALEMSSFVYEACRKGVIYWVQTLLLHFSRQYELCLYQLGSGELRLCFRFKLCGFVVNHFEVMLSDVIEFHWAAGQGATMSGDNSSGWFSSLRYYHKHVNRRVYAGSNPHQSIYCIGPTASKLGADRAIEDIIKFLESHGAEFRYDEDNNKYLNCLRSSQTV